jgi:hypothetical protein
MIQLSNVVPSSERTRMTTVLSPLYIGHPFASMLLPFNYDIPVDARKLHMIRETIIMKVATIMSGVSCG